MLQSADLPALEPAIRREVRNREVQTPPISTFRWWARRSHTLFGALVEAAGEVLGPSLLIADPFAGGGTTVLEAARRGHSVYGQDLNPWAVRGMRAMLALAAIPSSELEEAMAHVTEAMAPTVARAYYINHTCTSHTFRVATLLCPACGCTVWLYPYALLTLDSRRPDEEMAWFGCRRCGQITKAARGGDVTCRGCSATMEGDQSYLHGRWAACGHCGSTDKVSTLVRRQALRYQIVLVERARDGRRWFEPPGRGDLEAAETWEETDLPMGDVPDGKETAVLLRHGFTAWKDLYPVRQRAVLTKLLDTIERMSASPALRDALTVAAVGTAEMAGLGSRWDRFYLKAYEVTASHRFPFVPFTAEPNVWGHPASGRGTFIRRIQQLRKSIAWFGGRSVRHVEIVQGPSQRMAIADGTVDLVLTDPPYFGDVQYGELSSIFRAWLGEPTGAMVDEVLIDGRGKGVREYTDMLASVLAEAARTLRPRGRLVLTFHNRSVGAYVALAEALGTAGFRVAYWAWAASENERDFAKRDRAACTRDLVLECVKSGNLPTATPIEPGASEVEAHFLWSAGHALAACTQGQILPEHLGSTLGRHAFVGARGS